MNASDGMLRAPDDPPDPTAVRRLADDSPVAAVDETLVAYLDGELDEDERQSLEDRLLSDPELRRRLGELQSGWEMLDHLPQAHVTQDFARSTLEMVAASTSQAIAIQRQRQPRRLLGGLLLVATATLLMAGAGFAVAQWLEQIRFEAQLADLTLAEHLDAYQAEVDLQLIEQLSEDPQWNHAMRLAGEAGGLVVPEPLGLSERGPAERAELLSRLEPERRRLLTGQWERLKLLEPEQLSKVRQQAEAVRQQEQPADVLRTMKEYARWFESLTPDRQERIVSADDPRQVILEEVERSALGWVQDYGLVLGESDRELIYETLKLIARERLRWADRNQVWEDDRLRYLKDFRERWQQRNSPSDRAPFTAEEFLLGGMAHARWGADRVGPREQQAVLFGPPTEEEMEAIEEVISNKALLILNAASESPDKRQEALWRWCVSIIRAKSPAGNSPEVLLNRYLAMDPENREILDLKPPREIFDDLGGRRRSRFGGRRP